MTVFVALLRGVNVGRHNRVKMADVRSTLEAAGYDAVTTHIQSGNVLFASPTRSASTVGAAIEKALHEDLGLDIDVVVRTASALAKVTGANPFPTKAVDPKSLYVGFLKSRPAAPAARALKDLEFGRDEFALRGTELYLSYHDGYGRSKMGAAVFERLLRTPITARNWNVVTALSELAARVDS